MNTLPEHESPHENGERELEVHVAHVFPGRIRLKVPREMLDSTALHEAERALTALPGVREVRANPTARSVVIAYDEQEIGLADMLAAVSGAGVTVATPMPPTEEAADVTPISQSITRFFSTANRSLFDRSKGTADLRTLVPIGLAAFAVREVLAGRFAAAPWYVLLWYSFDSFLKLQRPRPS